MSGLDQYHLAADMTHWCHYYH